MTALPTPLAAGDIRRLLDCLNCAAFETDSSGVITYVNAQWENISGQPAEKALGCSLTIFVMQADRQHAREYLKRMLDAASSQPPALKLHLQHPQRGLLACLLNLTPLCDATGRRLGLAGVLQPLGNDPTLAQPASMAHGGQPIEPETFTELRVALNEILGLTALTLEAPLMPLQQHYLSRTRELTHGMLDRLSSLAQASRATAEAPMPQGEFFSLRQLLAGLLDRFLPRTETQHLTLTMHVDPEVPDFLIGTPGRLRQVLAGLLDYTAHSAQHQTPQLRVAPDFITADKASLTFFLAELAPATVAQLKRGLEAAMKLNGLDSSGNTAPPSILNRTARLIRAMGGKVDFSNNPEDTLRVTFQFTVCATQPAPPTRPKFATIVGMPVLIVEQAADERAQLAQVLKEWRMQPLEADSAPMAIALLERAQQERRPVPLALLANRIGGHDGFTLGIQIKHHPQLNQILLGMLTADGQRGDALKCNEIGIAAYLPKPINPTDLREAILAITGASAEPVEETTLVTRHFLRENR